MKYCYTGRAMKRKLKFEWDPVKNIFNQLKHGVSFNEAGAAFDDPKRIIVGDLEHSREEKRYFCLGKIKGGILTVRFVQRSGKIRIYGAGFWRKGKKRYEKENYSLH